MANPLSSTFSGDMGSVPNPKSGANEMQGPAGSPGTLDTTFEHGNWDQFHKAGNGSLGMTTEVDLPHGKATLDSPFTGDFRPGVDSSKH